MSTLRVIGEDQESEEQDEAGKLELKDQFVELRARGLSYAKIAKKLRVAKATLAKP